jgi:hypothetical protein
MGGGHQRTDEVGEAGGEGNATLGAAGLGDGLPSPGRWMRPAPWRAQIEPCAGCRP